MARFGKLPIAVPENVTVSHEDRVWTVKGPKGELSIKIPRVLKISEDEEKNLVIEITNETKQNKAMQGTYRSHLVNMIEGVTQGWKKILEINGAGYRVELRGKELVLHVGYSHPVIFEAPENVSFNVDKNVITIEGIDKNVVGALAADIRATRKPEPYKGAGIKYQDEVIRRKAGKQAVGSA